MAFKVQIVDINENADNIILVSGLTIETLKIKYNWILNASVKNCILGQDENGIVWYSGEWICGEWINGTWYSGIWHDGIWNNGKWYSYLIDQAMIISNRFVILDKNDTYSEFRSGIWKQGDLYGGTFGYDREISNDTTYSDLTGRTFSCSYWLDGKFHNGIFKYSVWDNGIFYNGAMSESYWLNGKFYNGTFNKREWYNGLWYGGDFIEGTWFNGSFDQINPSIKSRFGTAGSTTSQTLWYNGTFYNGEFHSGLNLDSSGNTIPSINSNKTHWINGNFRGGKWFGGHFHEGNFYNGNWYGGIFNTITGSTNYETALWYDGNWYNGLWINGTFYDGHFYDGMWLDGLFISGYISTNTVEAALTNQAPAAIVVPPSVITYSATTITTTTAVGNGRVTNNGGSTILDRGLCWSIFENPVTGNTTTNYYRSDGGSMGNISFTLNGLVNGTNYYVRTYAKNITGLTYGNQESFVTETSSADVPSVNITEVRNITSGSADAYGWLLNENGSTVTEWGFYYSDSNPDPDSGDTIAISSTPFMDAGEFMATLSPLIPETLYYIRAFAKNASGEGTSSILPSFTTGSAVLLEAPTVTTISIGAIADTSAITYATASNGNDPITAVGCCWSTSPTPTTGDDHTTESPVTGNFNTTMTGLLPETLYYVMAYATNSIGTGYGNELPLTTTELRSIPTVLLIKCVAV